MESSDESTTPSPIKARKKQRKQEPMRIVGRPADCTEGGPIRSQASEYLASDCILEPEGALDVADPEVDVALATWEFAETLRRSEGRRHKGSDGTEGRAGSRLVEGGFAVHSG